jgi:Protein of unknown function (DUF3800)
MHFLFLDESGKPDDKAFAIGGAAIRAEDWGVVRDRWHACLADHDWPQDKEVKWHLIRTGLIPPVLADALFAVLAKSPILCSVVVLRPLAGRQARPRFFTDNDETYATGLMFLAERFQRFLSREDGYGAIVLDSRRSEADERMRRFFERLQRDGTPYVTLDRIVDSLMLSPSHHSLGLQVADLVVACTLAARRGQGDASRWFKQLAPRFARHPDTGAVEGVGLVTFPAQDKGDPQAPAKLFTA